MKKGDRVRCPGSGRTGTITGTGIGDRVYVLWDGSEGVYNDIGSHLEKIEDNTDRGELWNSPPIGGFKD